MTITIYISVVPKRMMLLKAPIGTMVHPIFASCFRDLVKSLTKKLKSYPAICLYGGGGTKLVNTPIEPWRQSVGKV
jgi:hypothetical protein